MKSWTILTFLLFPVFAQAQANTPLSTRVEELLKKKQDKEAQEAATIEKIRKDAVIEKLQIDQRKKLEAQKVKKMEEAVTKRFIPKTPYLNYRPLPEDILWKSSLLFSLDSYESQSPTVKKEFKESHFYAVNELQYSWTKKLLFKYINTYHFSQTTKNDKRVVSGASITPDPDISNNKFGDHVFEVNFRKHREIFYNHDLDYFFQVVYPFGKAQRAYAYETGGESDTTTTTASQKGNLKSPFVSKAVLGIDYFTGTDRKRYNFGGTLAYALKGRYTVNKGTGYWSSSPTGLTVETENFAETKFWFNYQKRPAFLKKLFYGFGLDLHLLMQQEENIITSGADGFSWQQRNRIEEHFRLSGKTWVKYMLKDIEHIEFTLKLHLPYSYKIKKRVIDEGADGLGNRQFFNTETSDKVKSRGPIEISATYVRSF